MATTYCPECDAVISVIDPEIGAVFTCPECDVELEVVSASPFDVYYHVDEDWGEDWAEEHDEDWSDDYYN